MTPTGASQSVLDDAYDRLHRTGPEFDDALSNHGPMVVEAMAWRGRQDSVERWLDGYLPRLDEPPRPTDRLTGSTWREALGNYRRVGDWPVWFAEQLQERPWQDVLAAWWPTLLPGIVGGATHGVIRVGHAVRSLREHGETDSRCRELSYALGYWAARWQPVPGLTAPAGHGQPEAALGAVPPVPDQSGRIGNRLEQLAGLPGWPVAQARARVVHGPEDAKAFLRQLVIAAVRRYATHGDGDPVMLVHGATTPNAVLRILPSLPLELWVESVHAAWSATAAVHAAYARAASAPPALPVAPPDLFDLAVRHGDEHVVKLADTALDVREWSDDPAANAAVLRAVRRIEPVSR